MSLKSIMIEDITALPSTASVLDAAKFMTDMNVGSVIVTDDDRPSGMITDRDVVAKVIAQGKDSSMTMISEIMVSPVVSIAEDKDIVDATQLMSNHGIRRLPITNTGGKLVGVVSLDDVLVQLGMEMQNIATTLKKEIEH
ncbi:MAG: CBS domain-containing protein [Nitrospiraceae bacterium]|nr:MAG: CBS domain-containing protein [Nitrospiraceae bacterium]